jgi:hypothetical protein
MEMLGYVYDEYTVELKREDTIETKTIKVNRAVSYEVRGE